jgi:hypothetical protein
MSDLELDEREKDLWLSIARQGLLAASSAMWPITITHLMYRFSE